MTGARAPSRRLAIRFGIPAAGLLVSAIYAGMPSDSDACTCPGCWGAPEEELAEYDLVFLGKLVDSHEAFGCGSRVVLSFDVVQGFRGAEAGDRFELFTRADDQCGALGLYGVGDEAVVYTDSEYHVISDCEPHVAAGGHYETCSKDGHGEERVTLEDVVAALEAAID